MISGALVDGILAVSVLGLALWITGTRTAQAAVVGFMALGLLLALVWVRLVAPDVALTEAALGSGLTGVLLLGAAGALADQPPARPPRLALRVLIGALCAALAAGLAAVVLLLPEPAPTLAPLVAAHLPPTGVSNPITGVLMAHRALDTLLETLVLLPALIGIWSLAAESGWTGRPGSLPHPPPAPALTLLAQLLPPVGILVGVHLVWVGADDPGGKFQGAAVLAAMWVLVLVAGLGVPPRITGRGVRLLLIAGPLLFVLIGLAGIPWAGAFLAWPEAWAKPLILAIEAGLTLSVALTLALLLAGPPQTGARGPGA